MTAQGIINRHETVLGIELGSTRIKAVLSDEKGTVLATGFHDWENSLIDGIWTYSLDEVREGMQNCYRSLKNKVEERYQCKLTGFSAMGISAMMHGYIALDAEDHQLAPFQTWRNSNTEEAANALTELFQFNIPLRWTASHLYQRILDGEDHVKQVNFVTTLSSYVHYLLTGEKVIGIGDAAGIFPIDSDHLDYDAQMMGQFDELLAPYGFSWKAKEVFPSVKVAGEQAGILTEEGAKLLDPAGELEHGIPLCPPEGDAGTGMVATNAVAPRTGNVSVGTSTFAMLVLEKSLSDYYREIDMVTTPSGFPVAMSHANNGTSDLNAWVGLFAEFSKLMGHDIDMGELFGKLYTNALTEDADCGGLLSYGYYSGEGVTHLNEGRPLFVRTPDAHFSLANFMRAHLYSALGAVRLGLDILFEKENVQVDRIMGHGGFFKTPEVGQRCLAAAVKAPVTCMTTAGEGGAWGIALLAAYMRQGTSVSLEDWLENEIFASAKGETIAPTEEEIDGYNAYMNRYASALPAEKAAVETFF